MEQNKDAVAQILAEWEELKGPIEELFRNRDQKSTKPLMEKGIALFIQFLYLTNEIHPEDDEPIPFQQMEFKPVNLEERLGFIQSRPALFHSYRQLSELIMEQEKLFGKKMALKKSSRPKA